MGKSKELATSQDTGFTVDSGNGNFVYASTDGAIEIRKDGGGGYIDFHGSDVDYDVRIQHHNNGLAFNVGGDGNQITGSVIDASGRVTMPYQPAFTAHYGGGTIADGTVIAWNSTDYNTGGHYSTSTGRFTAPVAGKYAFFVQIHHAQGSGHTAAHQYFDIRKNGGTFHRFIGRWTLDDWYELTAQRVVELSAGDYVDVLVYYANGQWMGANRPDHNHFTGYLVG